jgi:hypothetical protein
MELPVHAQSPGVKSLKLFITIRAENIAVSGVTFREKVAPHFPAMYESGYQYLIVHIKYWSSC